MLRQTEKNGNSTFRLLTSDPYVMFADWYETACSTDEIFRPNACTLSTATKEGIPSSRIVSLAKYDKDGFRWNTNTLSRKGLELAENPHACLLFLWDCTTERNGELCGYTRQVRIEGLVTQQSEEEATDIFKLWPRSMQLSFAACVQDTVIPNMEVIGVRKRELEEQFKDSPELKPGPGWGGYVLKPHRFEFWQQMQGSDIADRIVFRSEKSSGETMDPNLTQRTEDGWLIERLAP